MRPYESRRLFKTILKQREGDEVSHVDYGMEAYRCEMVLRKRKKLNELYDLHSKLRYSRKFRKDKNRELLLKLTNENITILEEQLGL